MKSHCRFPLSEKMLSLYSSDTEIDGVKVTGPCWAGGAASPNNSKGYDPIGKLGGRGAGSLVVPDGWVAGSRAGPCSGACWADAQETAKRQKTIVVIAVQPSTCANTM